MQVTRDGVYSHGTDLCSTCVKDNDKCVFKKALSNYHSGGDMPLSLMVNDCPEYIRNENRNDRISFGDFTTTNTATFNPNAYVRFNTGEANSGT